MPFVIDKFKSKNRASVSEDFALFKVVQDPCQKITLLLLKSKSVGVIVPESCF